MNNRYIACMILHALGDTIGYKNSKWEFMSGSGAARVLEKVFEFIDLGGINYVPNKGWLVSDDTIMHMKTAKSLLKDYSSLNSFGNILAKNYISAYEQFVKEGLEKRYPGKTLMKNIRRLEKGEWNDMPYDYYAGGSGASMRSSCIGLAYHNNIPKLIQTSIESSRITHNSAVGYLGGMCSALFTAYAIKNINIEQWPFMLLDLFKSGEVEKYIRRSGRDIEHYMKDHHAFVEKWTIYVGDKFDKNKKPAQNKATRNLLFRSDYYFKTYAFKEGDEQEFKYFIGVSGDDSCIIAYDSLIDSRHKWEKMVFYSCLHSGDTDTTGCIAGSWYGALYGFGDVPIKTMKYLEYKKELEKLGQGLYNKFYKK
jgi:ADP-ribosylglycohydrolase